MGVADGGARRSSIVAMIVSCCAIRKYSSVGILEFRDGVLTNVIAGSRIARWRASSRATESSPVVTAAQSSAAIGAGAGSSASTSPRS